MFTFLQKKAPRFAVAFMLSEQKISVAAVNVQGGVEFANSKPLNSASREEKLALLQSFEKEYELIGLPCALVLSGNDYQLLQTDAMEVPENELSQALKWSLGHLTDYKLEEVCADAFLIPPHGLGGKRKKAFVALTPTKPLQEKLSLFNQALITIDSVSISELALGQLLNRYKRDLNTPRVVVDVRRGLCQLSIWFDENFYFMRDFNVRPLPTVQAGEDQKLLLELQRSIDFCVSELKLADPQEIIFSSRFFQHQELVDFLKRETGKNVSVLNLAAIFNEERGLTLTPRQQAEELYPLGAALCKVTESQKESSNAES